MSYEPPAWWQDPDGYPAWMHEAFSDAQMRLPNALKWEIAIRWRDDLNAGQKHTALTLATYMDPTKLTANPSVGTLARNCQRHPDTVRRALYHLQADGWLSITPFRSTKGNNRIPNEYAGLFPEDVDVDRPGNRTVGIRKWPPF